MHRPDNYGSYLQTFATYEFVKQHGFLPTVIDYAYPTSYHRSIRLGKKVEKPKVSFWHRKISGLCRRLICANHEVHTRKMRLFYEKHITMSKSYGTAEELRANPPEYDIYISGSDQVWNPNFIGHDTSFFLLWTKDCKKRIAYASSFAIKEIPLEYKESFSRCLKRFESIGIRERSNIISNLIGKESNVVLDPTFLFTQKEWAQMIRTKPLIKGKYILCYILSYNFRPYPYAYDLIKHIQKKTGYKVVLIDGDPIDILRGYKVMGENGPEDFVSLFMNASYVITSSFHGTAFAINFGKPFITIVDNDRFNTDDRQLSLVRELGVSMSRVVKKGENVNLIEVNENIEWHSSLEIARAYSIEFFKNALGHE